MPQTSGSSIKQEHDCSCEPPDEPTPQWTVKDPFTSRADDVPADGKKTFLPFKKALVHVRKLNLKNRAEWREWRETDLVLASTPCMPSHPDVTCKHDGWLGYRHWLGTAGDLHTKESLPFKKALVHARSLNLKSEKEWRAWAKTGARPANVPSAPHWVHERDGWQGHGHWLGTGNVAAKDQQFLPFEKALLHARSHKLKGLKDWQAWCKTGARPENVPSRPDKVCKHDGWQSWGTGWAPASLLEAN